jgi:hypothetical protein
VLGLKLIFLVRRFGVEDQQNDLREVPSVLHEFICVGLGQRGSIFFFDGSTATWGPRPPHFSRLHDHTFRHTTLGRTPLDEGPARRRDLYLTKHNTQKRQTSTPLAGYFFFFFFFCLSGVFRL